MLMLIQGIQCKWKIPLITEFLVMTVLKYNHNSLLLIRASHLVPPLLFVVSMVPWVQITLPRQTQREAQKLLHWDNKSCWISARSSPCTPLSSSQFQQGFPYGLDFSFLLFGGVGLPHTPSHTGNFACSPIHQQKKFSLLVHLEESHSHIKENWLGFIQICKVPWMPRKAPQVSTSN